MTTWWRRDSLMVSGVFLLRWLSCLCVLLFSLFICHESLAVVEAELPHDADIYLVPMGAIPHHDLKQLAAYYQELTGLRVAVTSELPILADIVNPARHQFIAERALAYMSRVFSPWIKNPRALVIGVSGYDMYIAHTDWRFAFAFGEGRLAIVSGARMSDGTSTPTTWSPVLLNRLRKMVSKRIIVQAFGTEIFTEVDKVLLSTPILGIEDLDRFDGSALEASLRELAHRSGRTPSLAAEEGDNTRLGDTQAGGETSQGWLPVIGTLSPFLGGAAFLIWLGILKNRDTRVIWKHAATRLSWRYSEQETDDIICGEIAGTQFVVDDYREGSGRNQQAFTRIQATLPTPFIMTISPKTGWLRLLRLIGSRLRTGDRAYDCRFIIEQSGTSTEHIDLPEELRQYHLEQPMTVSIGNGCVTAKSSGKTDDEDALIRQIQVVAAWVALLQNQPTPRLIPSASLQQRAYWTCIATQLAHLVFWPVLMLTFAIPFWIKTEQTNITWINAWHGLAPIMALVWIAWLVHLWPRLSARPIQHVFSATLIPFFVFGGVWLASGLWLSAWNALNVTSKLQPVIGLVIEKTMHSGKGGPSYHVTILDIDEQRPVEFGVSKSFYQSIRRGEPAQFMARKGRLGIYFWFAREA